MLLLNPEAKRGRDWRWGGGGSVNKAWLLPGTKLLLEPCGQGQRGQQRTVRLGHKRNWCRDSETRQWTLWRSELNLSFLFMPNIWQVCWMNEKMIGGMQLYLSARGAQNQLCHPPYEPSMSSLRPMEPIKMLVLINIVWHVLYCSISSQMEKTVYKTIHIIFRYLCLKGFEKNTHQNINSGTNRIVAFWVFYFLLYTMQNFLKFLWPEFIPFWSEKKKKNPPSSHSYLG